MNLINEIETIGIMSTSCDFACRFSWSANWRRAKRMRRHDNAFAASNGFSDLANRQVARFDWPTLIPIDRLTEAGNARLKNFREKELERWLRSIRS